MIKEFLNDTTVHGIEFFTSQNKIIRKFGRYVFYVAFCALGYFMYDLYVKWKINPIIYEEINPVPAYDYPFPAVTVCNPIFSRDQMPNLYKVLRNEKINLSISEQKILAANIQASAPHLGNKISKIYPNIDSQEIVKILKDKFHHTNDSFDLCMFRTRNSNCDRIFNYVLTDYGFCFSYNLQSFYEIFNSRTISDDFLCYQRLKIAKIYLKATQDFPSYETVNDEIDKVQWTLTKGYFNDSPEIQPSRGIKLNSFFFYPRLNHSDLSNLIPEAGKTFSVFIHMPNEILTPFQDPVYFRIDSLNYLNVKIEPVRTKTELRRYSPEKRWCYFSNEKSLKYFASYTKFQCEFECLANRTLEACGCVKFSMPRDNSTPICGLNQTSCYLKVFKGWSRESPTCECFLPCNFIDYKIKYIKRISPFSHASATGHVFSNR